MSNPLMGMLGNGTNPMLQKFKNQFELFKQNPQQFLMNRKLNIPQQFQNNPKDMVQYLLDSGQMSQQTYNNFNQLLNNMH